MSAAPELEIRLYPTKVQLPLWVSTVGITAGLATLSVLDVEITQINPTFDLKFLPQLTRKNLMVPSIFPHLPAALNSATYVEMISAQTPVDGREIVEWMHSAAANYAMLLARADEYNRLGSRLLVGSNDAYVPGLRVDDSQFTSVSGTTVSTQGYGEVNTPRGTYRVPAGGKADGIFRDHLSWAAIPRITGIQWVGVLAKWAELARTPIRDAVGFPNAEGRVGPQYFTLASGRPAMRVNVRAGITSDKPQKLTITLRDPSDFTRVIANFTVDIPTGSSEIRFRMRAIPYVPPMVTQIYPQDNTQTRLDYLITTP